MTLLPLRRAQPLVALCAAAFMLAGCNTTPKSEAPSTGGTGTSTSTSTTKPAAKPAAAPTEKTAEGEIVGTPAPNSKFTQLKFGMGMKQVTDIIGQPTDQGAYITGKAFIPFYFGGDRYRHELAYKGQGR
ncbi:MAG: hypothetical protein RLZZ618_829, partial [Pseudomonadota bacterium]